MISSSLHGKVHTMFAASVITFRETLEAALIVGIILTLLYKTRQRFFVSHVWRGVVAGIGISIILAFALDIFFGGLSGKVEKFFEVSLMFITAGFLTWMILWVHRQKDVAKKMRERVAAHTKEGYGAGIFLLVGTSIFREGTEMVLYLKASSFVGQSNQLIGAVIGIIAALVLGYVLFTLAIRVNLAGLFTVTSVFLLLFAAGLVAHGVHEFQEMAILPVFSFDPVFNISHVLDHKGTLGSVLRTLFGYTSTPTILEMASYTSYIFFIYWLKKFTDNRLRFISGR